jgi:hypothetical protein
MYGAHNHHLPPAKSSAPIRVCSCPQKSWFLDRFCSHFLAPHPRKISYKYPLIPTVFPLKNFQETLTPEPDSDLAAAAIVGASELQVAPNRTSPAPYFRPKFFPS